MKNILLELAFVGSAYSGWQRQKNGLAIAQVIEDAACRITGESIRLTGCSRTDAGVHAEQFFANFNTGSTIPVDRFRPALQSELPQDILIKRSREVPPDFNARRDALEKTYRYQIYLSRSPFFNQRWWQSRLQLDYELLPQLATLITGEHDFSGFCVRRSLKDFNICLVKKATWQRNGRRLYFQITGNRFLHRMVRFLVGAQVEVASGKMSKMDLETIIQHPERRRALFTAPPDGLYLTRVKYNNWRSR